MTDPSLYRAAETRYDSMEYRRSGRSGLKLPAISLGLWHNFGDDRTLDSQRATLRRAFDLGVTHFDLANNYGPPPGSAELNFGKIFRPGFPAIPGRNHPVDEGRLSDASRPVRRMGLAEVPAVLARRVVGPNGC
ncbi:hypothetical protein GCM10020000_29380 [Streptomyces olivoverticillatus]